MRYILSMICCLLVFNLVHGQKQVIDKIVAQVGDELVLLSELEENYSLLKERSGGELPPDARCVVLENILVKNLLLYHARLDSIQVTDEEVEAQLDARIEQILTYMNNDLEQFRSYYEMTVAEAKDAFRVDLRNQILTQRMQQQLMNDIKVTPSEVKNFFNSIPVDSLPYFNSEVEIREIVMKPEVSASERERAVSKLEDLRKQILEEGADFAELAKVHSDDFGSARIGGDLGMQRRGTFVPEFEATVFNLEKDEISEVIETEFGFHLIQLLERRGNNIHARHILIKPRITDEDVAKTMEKLDSIRQLILTDSMTFSLAVKRFSNEKLQSYSNDGRVVNPKTGDTFYEIGDLDPDIYFAIDTLDVGGITEPFQFQMDRDQIGVRIIMLESRTIPHKANLEEDYAKIKQAAIEQKKNKFLNEWVVDNLGNTYINVGPFYQDCENINSWLSQQP